MRDVLGWIGLILIVRGVWSLLRWPQGQCRWCGGKGRRTTRTLFGNTVSRPCTHCVGGWRNRLGAKTKARKR